MPLDAKSLGRVSELVESRPAPVPPPLPAARPDRWRKLAELTAAINQERDLDRLLERILDGVLSLIPARGAFLVTLSGEQLELRVARNFDAAALDDPNGAYRLSFQTCREAIESKRPILTKDAMAESALQGFESISSLKLRALLCVPFGAGGESMGVVYLDEPVLDQSSSDLIELVSAFGDLAGIAFANARHLSEVRRRERLSEELKIASRIQRKLLPETAPVVPGLELAGRTIPAEEVGGDLYDFFPAPSGDLFVSIGDVSGKGAGAGIVMASVRVAGAGHEHLLVVRARSAAVERLRSGGVVLGLSPDIASRVEEKRLDLDPGDLVVLYTDGATEAASPEGEELGLDRLAAIVGEVRGGSPQGVIAHIVDRVQRWTGAGHPPRDDLTVVALRRA